MAPPTNRLLLLRLHHQLGRRVSAPTTRARTPFPATNRRRAAPRHRALLHQLKRRPLHQLQRLQRPRHGAQLCSKIPGLELSRPGRSHGRPPLLPGCQACAPLMAPQDCSGRGLLHRPTLASPPCTRDLLHHLRSRPSSCLHHIRLHQHPQHQRQHLHRPSTGTRR